MEGFLQVQLDAERKKKGVAWVTGQVSRAGTVGAKAIGLGRVVFAERWVRVVGDSLLVHEGDASSAVLALVPLHEDIAQVRHRNAWLLCRAKDAAEAQQWVSALSGVQERALQEKRIEAKRSGPFGKDLHPKRRSMSVLELSALQEGEEMIDTDDDKSEVDSQRATSADQLSQSLGPPNRQRSSSYNHRSGAKPTPLNFGTDESVGDSSDAEGVEEVGESRVLTWKAATSKDSGSLRDTLKQSGGQAPGGPKQANANDTARAGTESGSKERADRAVDEMEDDMKRKKPTSGGNGNVDDGADKDAVDAGVVNRGRRRSRALGPPSGAIPKLQRRHSLEASKFAKVAATQSTLFSLAALVSLGVVFAGAMYQDSYGLAILATLALGCAFVWSGTQLPGDFQVLRQVYIICGAVVCYVGAMAIALEVTELNPYNNNTTLTEPFLIVYFSVVTGGCFVGALFEELWFLSSVAAIGGMTSPFLLEEYMSTSFLIVFSQVVTLFSMLLYAYHSRNGNRSTSYHLMPYAVAITGWMSTYVHSLLVVTSWERSILRGSILLQWTLLWIIPLYVLLANNYISSFEERLVQASCYVLSSLSGCVCCFLLSTTSHSFIYWSTWAFIMGLLYGVASSVLEWHFKRSFLSWAHYGLGVSMFTIAVTMLFRGNVKNLLLAFEAFVITYVEAIHRRLFGTACGVGMWCYVLLQSANILIFTPAHPVPFWNVDAMTSVGVLTILSLLSVVIPSSLKIVFETLVHAFLHMLIYHELEWFPEALYIVTALYPAVLLLYAMMEYGKVTADKTKSGSIVFANESVTVYWHDVELYYRVLSVHVFWAWLCISQTLPRLLLLWPAPDATPVWNVDAMTSVFVMLIMFACSYVQRADWILSRWVYRMVSCLVVCCVLWKEVSLIL